jgi:predicted MPP superfamily phosphohydrolase
LGYTIAALVVLFVVTIILVKRRTRQQAELFYPPMAYSAVSGPDYPDLKFAVISDTHYYDRSLGDSGPAFEAYLLTDRKLVKESTELIELAIDEILYSDVDVVLIPGDLSCEGELLSHRGMAKALCRLKDNDRRVFVIPGNHDINMLHGAVRYRGIGTEPAESISAEQFADIYRDFGYADALYRDDQSLSYVAPISDSLWLLAIDTCRYQDNTADIDQVGSKLTQPLIDWLATIFKKAAAQNIAVMTMIHHGVVEHWAGQSKLHPDFLVEDYKSFNRFLALAGVRLAFSGHYHSQDIALADYEEDGFLYDIETGSLITPPCPIRYATIEKNKIKIRSDNLIEKLRPGSAFAEEANAFVLETLEYEIINTLRKYLVTDRDALLLAQYVAKAFVAHARGDESPDLKPIFDSNQLSIWGRFIYARQKNMIDNLWSNLPPADLNITLDLKAR